jgi:hypothetical protein
MKKFELTQREIYRLQRTIITAALYPYYLQKYDDDIDKAYKAANLTELYLQKKINQDVDSYSDSYFDTTDWP